MHSNIKLNHCFRSYTRKTLKIVQTAHWFQSALFLFKGCCLTDILLWYTIYTSLKLVFIWNMLVFKWNMYNHAIYIKKRKTLKKKKKKQYWPKKEISTMNSANHTIFSVHQRSIPGNKTQQKLITNCHWSQFMSKPVYAICKQQRRRSACASAQSDQHLCCSLPG